MGTYLSTNLWIDIQISRESVQNKKFDEVGLINFLKEEADLQPDIYEREDTEQDFVFHLKPSLIAQELIPFLEAYYAVYYKDPQRDESTDLLNTLRSLTPEGRAAYIEEDTSYTICPQDDQYRLGSYHNALRVNVHYWRLTFEGKVMAEEMGAHLRLFNYALRRAFADFKIAQALDVTLLG